MNLRFESELKKNISLSLQTLFGLTVNPVSILLQETKKEFEGDVTLVVFPFTKASGKSPESTAEAIGNFLMTTNFPLSKFNVVKGFLNLSLKNNFWTNFFAATCSNNSL